MAADDDAPKSYIKLTITPDPGFELTLDAMTAEEELGRPFLITVDVSCKTAQSDLYTHLGANVTVTLSQAEGDPRYFNGILARFAYTGFGGGAFRYRLELRPWIWLLSQVQDCKIFQSKSAWDIILAVFQAAGFSDYADKRQNSAGSAVLTYCVQYRETSLDFVTRLMEEYGIYYFVTHSDGSHVINLADDPNSHSSVGEAIPYHTSQRDWRQVDDHIWDWSGDARIRPGTYTLRDYNFTTPSADLTAKSTLPGGHPYGSSEVYDYPGDYETVGDGQTLASVRMQERAALRQSYGGTSNSRKLLTGSKFTLSQFSEDAANTEYLIIRTACSVTVAESLSRTDGELIDSFLCSLEAINGGTTFRLAKTTPLPMIRGPQTAVVVGASGNEITTDQYGRIKVQFPWDRVGTNDENSSCWIRVAQIWAGTAWGAMFIPRIGQEVVVEFLEGNPNRPIVTGRVYNATQTVPYSLPDNATRSTIKSNSSTGGGGFNELRFEDKKGSEEVFFQAQKDYNAVVLNNETNTVTQDSTTTIKQGNRSVTVSQGNDSHTVSQGKRSVTVSTGDDEHTVSQGNRTVTVSTGKDALTVSTGDHTITVTAGNSTISAGTSITLKVGQNSIKIDTTGITLTATEITLSATGALQASGATAKVAGQTMLELDGGATATLKGGMVMIN